MQSVTSTSTRVLATRPVRVTLRPSSRQPMRICAVQNKEKTKPGFAAEVDVPAFTR
jgi:hypothetical protein